MKILIPGYNTGYTKSIFVNFYNKNQLLPVFLLIRVFKYIQQMAFFDSHNNFFKTNATGFSYREMEYSSVFSLKVIVIWPSG